MTRLLLHLIERATPPTDREWVLGDTVEEFERRTTSSGPGAARRWLAAEACRVLWCAPFLRRATRTIPSSAPPSASRALTFPQDMRYAFRVLRQRPGFTTAAIVSLALGIGANVAIFSAVRAVLFDEPPYPQADRLVRVTIPMARRPPQPLSQEDVEALRTRPDTFGSVATCTWATVNVRGESALERVEGPYVSPEFFDVFGLPPLIGRAFEPQEFHSASHVALLSHRLWRSQFGGASDVVGRTIQIDREPWTVVGVMPPDFTPECRGNSTGDVWRPFLPTPESREPNLQTYARLTPGATIDSARRTVANLHASKATTTLAAYGAVVERLKEGAANAARPGLLLLQSISAFVLILMCTNLATLFLAHASARQYELGIRAALGAGRARIVRQLLAEAWLIATAASVLGAALAYWLVPMLRLEGPGRLGVIPAGTLLSVRFPEFLLSLGLGWLTATVFGLAPAWLTSKTDAFAGLRSNRQSTPARSVVIARSTLVAAQVLLAVVLISGTALVLRSFTKVMALPLGIDPRGLLVANLYVTEQDITRSLNERLEAVMHERFGAADVTLAGGMPFTTTFTTGFALSDEATSARKDIWTRVRWVTSSYFSTLRQPMLRGRAFTADDANAIPLPVIVNESFEKLHGDGHSLIGRHLSTASTRVSNQQRVVVGVVADVRTGLRTQGLFDAVYEPLTTSSYLSVVIRAQNSPAMERSIREAVREVSSNIAVLNVESLESLVDDYQIRRHFTVLMLVAFGTLAALLAALGIFSVMSQTVGQRLREAGIRIALGARPQDIRVLFLGGGLKPVVIGLAGGIAAAWWVAGLLRDNPEWKAQLFQVRAQDPWSIGSTAILVLVTGLLACWLPTRRANRVDPAETLRAD